MPKKFYALAPYGDPDVFVAEVEAGGPSRAEVDVDDEGYATVATYLAPGGQTLTVTASAPLPADCLASVLVTSWHSVDFSFKDC